MSHILAVLRALVGQAATTLPESNYALRRAREVLAGHEFEEPTPWAIAGNNKTGYYAYHARSGERTPLRTHIDSTLVDIAQQQRGSVFTRALAGMCRDPKPSPKATRQEYEARIRRLTREQLEYLLRSVPAPTYAATLDALRDAAVRYFRWGHVCVADIEIASTR